MNRKLLNGLLVLAVAAGGVGTFTSCKDEDFNNKVLLDQLSLQAQIDAIRSIDDATFKKNLEDWLNTWTQDASGYDAEEENPSGFASYDEMVAAANEMWKLFQLIKSGEITPDLEEYVEKLYDWMFNNKIQASDWYKLIYQLADRATSVEVSQVYNPVFGSYNLPIGLNTTVLATYLYDAVDKNFTSFPAGLTSQFADASPVKYTDPGVEGLQDVIQSLSKEVSVPLANTTFTTPSNFGNMGGAVISINPSSVDFTGKNYTVDLINSKGEVALSSVVAEGEKEAGVELVKYDDLLSFGSAGFGTKASTPATGLYALKANATESNYENMKFDLDKSSLKDAVKQAIANKKISDLGHLANVVFESFNNKLPAYGVRVSWDETVVDPATGNAAQVEGADGEMEDQTITNSVTSAFNIAAVVAHPLSYNTHISSVITPGKYNRIPVIHNALSYYLSKIKNKLHFSYEVPEIGEVTVDFKVEIITVSDENPVPGYTNGQQLVHFTYTNENGETVDGYSAYNADGITISNEELTSFVNAVLAAMNAELQGDLNYKMIADLNDAINSINKEISRFEGKLEDFKDLIDRIEGSKALNVAQHLVDFYNDLATKANDFLKDPDHYMQITMAFSTGNGPMHAFNDINMPMTVDTSKGEGDGFELYMTSYMGDVVVPSYQKYLAITGVVDGTTVTTDGLAALNQAANLNKVYPGWQQTTGINVSGLKGKTVRLTYISVDYRGMCSMNNYYLRVK